MKTIPPACPGPETGPHYWRSLDQLADTPEFRDWVEREFPAGASELTDPVTRRSFVKLMSASFMLAGLGLTGCRRPEEKIVPFSRLPEGYVHGAARYYATAMPTQTGAVPLIVRSNDGRPTKIEGNSMHPDSNGATDAHAQASILNLYDPDRSQRFLRSGSVITREAAWDALRQIGLPFSQSYGELGVAGDGAGELAAKRQGQGLSFLLTRKDSPSRERLVRLLRERFPKAGFYVHEPVDHAIHQEAATQCFGKDVTPYYRFDDTRVVVSLDADFLGTEEEAWLHARRYAQSRRLRSSGDEMCRLYAVESLFTLTGANADHRLRLPASQLPRVAAQLASAVLADSGLPGSQTGDFLAAAVRQSEGLPPGLLDPKWIAECARDLVAHKGRAVVVAGHRQPVEVHLLAHAMNVALEAVGRTIVFQDAMPVGEPGLPELARALNEGRVDTLVILDGNPVYTAPADLDWARTQRKAKSVVRLGYYEDETTQHADLHLPLAHYLESWGDARTADGTLVPVQPLIQPLFGGVTELEVLARLAPLERTNPYDIVRETFARYAGSDEEKWKGFLHDGFLADSGGRVVDVQFDWAKVARAIGQLRPANPPSLDRLELVFHRDAKVGDGRYVNNGWLQEMPDPVTKMTWENVILLSQATADALGLRVVDRNNNNLRTPLVRLEAGGYELTGPAWVQPGMADFVVGLALGYGQSHAGRVGQGAGYNAYQLRSSLSPHLLPGARLSDTGREHPLATTQNHWSLEGRPIIREANLAEYQANPRFAQAMNMHEPAENRPLYPNPMDIRGPDGLTPREKAHHQWGMSVDLNACTGCSACVIACQSENNVPIVGKEQVRRQREMHWLRVDRYFAGPVADPQMVTQPMFCLHCESAPCESVCPVNATVHDDEGLNVMVYNRCVGTRYCSNNCPYKVRRFNYFDYQRRPLDRLYQSPLTSSTRDEWELKRWFKNPDRGSRPHEEFELAKLVKNPDVTVRMRGIMEKCTYCIQRIEQAKIARKVAAGPSGDVLVRDGEIRTACQQACPAEAIVFGNIKDAGSEVSRLKALDRTYLVLEFLATKPRTSYLARVRNPNPQMPDAQQQPLTTQMYLEKNPPHHGPHGADTHGAGAGDGKGGH
jgi:molybdopterin-containing oxidoreductase family iron-sulfur binding subunit